MACPSLHIGSGAYHHLVAQAARTWADVEIAGVEGGSSAPDRAAMRTAVREVVELECG